MSKTQKNVPKLRFPGFDEAWEQRKYSDLATIRRGLTYKPESIVNGGKRVLRSSNINEDSFEIHEDDVFVDEAAVNIPYAKNGDILITSANGSSRLVGKHAIIRDIADNSVVHGGFMLLASSEEPEFVNALMSSQWYLKFIGMYVAGGNGAIGNLNKNDLDEQIVSVPKIEEQRRIGNFFGNLDALITLQQRKLDQIKEYKKGMLQRMFPKEGESLPEVRFPGFSGEWERCTVGDFYDFKNGLNKGKEFFGKGTPIVNFTDVFHNRGIFPEELKGKVQLEPSEIKNYEVKKGDIFFTRTSETIEEIGYPSVMLGAPENTVFSGFVLRGRCIFTEDPLDDYFKKYVFFTDTFRTEMLKKSSMTTRALTSGTAIKNMEFRFPKSKGEQHAIGLLLTSLDTFITLHQRKLEAMKEYKKGLLQQMFV